MLEVYDLLDAPDLDTADMVLFFTDGNPTSYSTGSDGSGSTSACSGGGSTESPEIVNPMKLANYFKEYLGTQHVYARCGWSKPGKSRANVGDRRNGKWV